MNATGQIETHHVMTKQHSHHLDRQIYRKERKLQMLCNINMIRSEDIYSMWSRCIRKATNMQHKRNAKDIGECSRKPTSGSYLFTAKTKDYVAYILLHIALVCNIKWLLQMVRIQTKKGNVN